MQSHLCGGVAGSAAGWPPVLPGVCTPWVSHFKNCCLSSLPCLALGELSHLPLISTSPGVLEEPVLRKGATVPVWWTGSSGQCPYAAATGACVFVLRVRVCLSQRCDSHNNIKSNNSVVFQHIHNLRYTITPLSNCIAFLSPKQQAPPSS